MDKKSKILIWVFVVLIIGAVGATYWRIMIRKDYVISSQIDCDPYTEKCFIWQCDPASTVEGEKCTGDAATDTWYYKIAQRNASRIPLCDPKTDDTCQPFVCVEGEKDCSETLCDAQTKVEQKVECSDPEQYTKDNPPAEEATPCDPATDETCTPVDGSSATDGTAPADNSAGTDNSAAGNDANTPVAE